jgi:bifunctional non-homologous end joining protein LigD
MLLATRRGMATKRARQGPGARTARTAKTATAKTARTAAGRPAKPAAGRKRGAPKTRQTAKSVGPRATTSASKGGARASATSSGRKTPATGAARGAAKSAAGARPLAEYNAKRDFSRTREPAGVVPRSKGKALHFVVQKHEASHLHYDFRLELDGVMKSWAVPKGPSYDPGVRRLAMEVEDHPISYNTFEGTIPSGEYGGGTVMLWDRGTYEPEDGGGVESLRRGYEKGDLKIVLHGKRLQGGWVLVRMKRPGRPQWLLIKHRDEHADPDRDITAEAVTSVVTKRSMEQIASGRRVWHSNR